MKQLVSFQCSLACVAKINPFNVHFSVVPKFGISSRCRERVAFAAIETYRCSFHTSKDPKARIMVILTKVHLQSWSCRIWLSMHGIWDSTVLGGSRQVAYVGLGSILELLKWVFFSHPSPTNLDHNVFLTFYRRKLYSPVLGYSKFVFPNTMWLMMDPNIN